MIFWILCSYFTSALGKIQITNKIGFCHALELTQSSGVLAKNADSSRSILLSWNLCGPSKI